MNLEFGQKITVDYKLVRRCDHNKGRRTFKFWGKMKLAESKEATIIGTRTLSNGEVEYEYEIGNIYYQKSFIKALLVATDMRTNPFYVLLEDFQDLNA